MNAASIVPGFVVACVAAFAVVLQAPVRSALQTKDQTTDDKKRAVRDDDYKILDVVLLDVFDYKAFRIMAVAGKKNRIVLDVRSLGAGWSSFLSDDRLDREDHDKDPHFIPAEIRQDLRRRNSSKPVSLSQFKPASPKVLIEHLNESDTVERSGTFREKYPDAAGFLQVWLPGYSKDGRTAVFRACFGPVPHLATVTYHLAKNDGRWIVVWRTWNSIP
jgi:hypothetical protein